MMTLENASMSVAEDLIKKAESRDVLFGIIGLGYVGLRSRSSWLRRAIGSSDSTSASGWSTASTTAGPTSRTFPTRS